MTLRRRRLRRFVAFSLALFAIYNVYVIVRSTTSGNGHGETFWGTIGLIVVLTALATLGARQFWRQS